MSSNIRNCVQHTYHSSLWENTWLQNVNAISDGSKAWSRGCYMLQSSVENSNTWMNMWKQRQRWRKHQTMSVTWNTDVISHHNFTNVCKKSVLFIPIEPLVGFLRHPWFEQRYCKNPATWDFLTNKDYMFSTWSFETHVDEPRGRSYLFDLGSGPGPGGSGQNWFTKTYRERGIVFDRVLAWEAKPYTPEQWLSTLPLDVHDVVSFYNVAVDPSLGSRNNPLRVLQTLAHPNDFVVLKLDIDNCEVEEKLVHQILNDSTLSTLIDELYWEHHVQMSPMQYKGWGLHINRYTNQTLASSYKLFRSLRTQGIRAHSWI